MDKIGVFICHCGKNIAGTVDIKKVIEEIGKYPGVSHCEDYKYVCSDPGQNLVKTRIKEKGLMAVVIACCSPTLHEVTFRRTALASGMNPYLLEIANIREQCSWVHAGIEEATPKAVRIIKTIIEKVRQNEALKPAHIPVTQRALVIGGGIAGIQASLDIANSGYEVVLVEKSPSIGGHMAQLSETFPTLDCSQCILTPKMVDVGHHEKIKLLVHSEIEEISGSVGNFKVKIRKKASCVDDEKCTGCGVCWEKCPVKVDSEFDEGLGKRKAIYTPFPQAVPNRPVIDRENCTYFVKGGKCKVCQLLCPAQAVDFDQADKMVEVDVGTVVVATGYELYSMKNFPEYGGGRYKNVINGLQFERMLSASGPTQGEVRRPSDGRIPKRVAFVSCIGSRDPEHHMPYCSKVCCVYNVKHAMLYKEHIRDGEAFVFSIDVRTAGKGYEEFLLRGKRDEKIIYIRGKPGRIIQEKDDLEVWVTDTFTAHRMRIKFDMVVLAMALIPSAGALNLSKVLRIQADQHGFFSEAHPKLRPVESLVAGFFLAGCAQAPKDIPDTVAQASAAASKVVEMFNKKELLAEPYVAFVDEKLCAGCRVCVAVCPYSARVYADDKKVVTVNEALCQGCGACTVACSSGAAQMKNLKDKQLMKMVEVVCRD